LTIQVHVAVDCTTSVCAPRLDCGVTDCPDAPVSLIAGVPVGDDPAGTTKTWNDGPVAGAGAHSKAQPIFHGATVVVNEVLVQFPWSCGESRSWRAGPAAAVEGDVVGAVEVVVAPALAAVVVVVEPPPAVVVVVPEPPPVAAVVVVLPPAEEPEPAALGGGSVSCLEADPLALEPPPVSPLIHIPTMTAIRTAVSSCHVFQDRFCLILSSPGLGVPSIAPGG
jgi:hypothetical protein